MLNFTQKMLPEFINHRLGNINIGDGLIFPRYDGYSICNLPSSICNWLGIPGIGNASLNPIYHSELKKEYQHVVLMVMDGLGINTLEKIFQLEEYKNNFPHLHNVLEHSILAPMTSVVPSTTAAALTTLWTGRTPAEHNILAYDVWLKEYGMVANMIYQSATAFRGDADGLKRADFQPETFLTVPTLGSHMVSHGVQPYAYLQQSISRSGLSTMLKSKANIIPFKTGSDLWGSLKDHLEENADNRTYHYIYWSSLDELSHKYGPEDERPILELLTYFYQMDYFFSKSGHFASGDTLFLLTADHGHLFAAQNPDYELINHPDLVSCMTMFPAGEARLPFLFVRSGREETLNAYINNHWPGKFLLIPIDDVIRSGLMGNSFDGKNLYDRVGDYLVVPQGNAYWVNKNNTLLGRHGGLSPIEMLVPFLAFQW